MTPASPSWQLTTDQNQALQKMLGGDNVFLTGAAGTGKSTVVRAFAQAVSAKTFPLLASTGVAAVLVGGRTFHSFFGLGIMDGGEAQTLRRGLDDKKLKSRLRKVSGFLVDEVSMLSAAALRVAEQLSRAHLEKEAPWGGLQVIAVGDFAQLPPVERNGGRSRSWVFHDGVWASTAFMNVVLSRSLRTEEEELLDVLGDVRLGIASPRVREFLNARLDETAVGSDRTHLFARRDPTERFNVHKLNELPGETLAIPTEYGGHAGSIQALKKIAPVPETLQIKIGCRVMLRQNDPRGRWVNGTVGIVREVSEDELWLDLVDGRQVKVEKTTFQWVGGDGQVAAVAINFPLQLAYATTIHKSQGATLGEAVLDLERLWEPGQAYVALSRVSSAAGIRVISWSPQSIHADRDVLDFYDGISAAGGP
jgi:ATP-dependent exoDNAse (exonuclease V) alpha subunit